MKFRSSVHLIVNINKVINTQSNSSIKESRNNTL